ncbi:bifunctional enoyl-CoA hydratase/phosphate acetyltransferase [Paracoccus marinaquae]|uniref:Bifunctional enoyl-CoA hydratase/phosphate acetyltransferase n=1 Tax=Paracoccus marinaquae TaxID=2841926 RepID=A0ABS6AD73_9RHOB|nr:bifunctional enoyl-CoA hydratase/phosphate acetyltransferase [Paracoccus marinaquae]MBU3028547.1 bifunctional enoyl-CoA hydratase/phosphate acetyltransferase [Paracoccus marinaquae]
MSQHYQDLIDRCGPLPPLRTAVVHPVRHSVFEAVTEAVEAGLIEPVLIGPAARIAAALTEAGHDPGGYEIVDTEHSHAAARTAAQMASAGQVGAIMKGSLHSDELLEAVIDPACGLRTERRISHAFLMISKDYPRPFIITDAAVNIAPGLAHKVDIVQNAVAMWRVLWGPERPRVAILAAVETVNPQMQATLDAAALCKMADRGQITDARLDGPLAFDNAVSQQAAREKGIVSEVAGLADIMLVPDIESGNMLAKQLIFMGGADAAGLVLGARVPIMLTSRADSVRARLLSCALAVLMAEGRRKGQIK